jgi:hypothetical protein
MVYWWTCKSCRENPFGNMLYVIQDWINIWIKNWLETNNISDWYHTFGELYEHRIILFISLCRQLWKQMKYSSMWNIVKSKKHFDWSEMEWWFIVQVETDVWQISYHIPNKYWDECEFIETLDIANQWDWHTSNDVLERLLKI